jgi:LysR family transcriptional regulator, transcriptional activator for aaeXAB operon
MSMWHRQLSVLSRAIHFQNLSAASQNVGLSQPQLSRVVAQLESGLGVVLLDRAVKRKTTWTPVARHLAEVFDRNEHRLERAMQEVLTEALPTELKAACLEGLAPLAVSQMGKLVNDPHWRRIQLDVLDQNELEERFLAGEVDVIWSSRIPGKGKPRHCIELGYQILDERDSGRAIDILSGYENARQKRKKSDRQTLISNSLRVRELWFEKVGGKGRFPSPVLKERARSQREVLLLGSELLPEKVWDEFTRAVEVS